MHGLVRFVWFDIFLEKIVDIVVLMRIFGSWDDYSVKYPLKYLNFDPAKKFIMRPEDFLRKMAIVLKSPSSTQKGLILLAYNYSFPVFSLIFNLDKVLKKYNLVLEPSTNRLFMPEILIYKGTHHKIYVQTNEHRDMNFLNRYIKNCVAVPTAANWWVDTRIFKPDTCAKKDFDIIMVSSWLKLKRHTLLFEALKKLKGKGIILKCCLVGYPLDLNLEDIKSLARKYDIEDQLTTYEKIKQSEIADLYRRSKINLLLSKREGSNRTLIEGGFCGTPFMIREGFNFGQKYNYLNSYTGRTFKDKSLDQDIMHMLENIHSYKPYEYFKKGDVSPYAATRLMEEIVYGSDDNLISMKVSGLGGMHYLHPEDEAKFEDDYLSLLAMVRNELH